MHLINWISQVTSFLDDFLDAASKSREISLIGIGLDGLVQVNHGEDIQCLFVLAIFLFGIEISLFATLLISILGRESCYKLL